MANDPDIEIICEAPGGTYRGTIIREKSGGYEVESKAGEHPGFGYDRDKFELEYDPDRCTDSWVQFKLRPKARTK